MDIVESDDSIEFYDIFFSNRFLSSRLIDLKFIPIMNVILISNICYFNKDTKPSKNIGIMHDRCKYVFIRLLLRNLIRDIKIFYVDRVRLSHVMSKIPRNSLSVRVRNRDAITGYPRSYVRKLGLSRHSINEMQSEGYIPGLYMAMW